MRRIREGDTVEVISGNDKGLRGAVNAVLPARSRVVVHGVNLVKKHQRRVPGVRTQTGIIEFEAPIHISNVMLVCPTCDQAARVGVQVDEDGVKSRVCKSCGAVLDKRG